MRLRNKTLLPSSNGLSVSKVTLEGSPSQARCTTRPVWVKSMAAPIPEWTTTGTSPTQAAANGESFTRAACDDSAEKGESAAAMSPDLSKNFIILFPDVYSFTDEYFNFRALF